MRENRTYGSEGGETGYSTGLSYPYRSISTELTVHSTAARRQVEQKPDKRPILKCLRTAHASPSLRFFRAHILNGVG